MRGWTQACQAEEVEALTRLDRFENVPLQPRRTVAGSVCSSRQQRTKTNGRQGSNLLES